MQARFIFWVAPTLSLWGAQADITVQMNAVDEKGIGKSVGQVSVSETPYGVVFSPLLSGLPQGLHGFHVHENPSCEPKEQDGKMVPALAAGGHFDPATSKRHGLPWGDGHLGDLPAMFVDAMGNASNPVLAPRLKLIDVKGHSLMVHAGGDNHGIQLRSVEAAHGWLVVLFSSALTNRSRGALRAPPNSICETYPEAAETLEDLVAEDSTVAARHQFHGPQHGPLGPYPLTGLLMSATYRSLVSNWRHWAADCDSPGYGKRRSKMLETIAVIW